MSGIRSLPTFPDRDEPRRDSLLRHIREDLDTVVARDPSRPRRRDALLHAPWYGLILHRVAHRLHVRGYRLAPGLLTLAGRLLSGMEIHPGARIGRRLFIDHGFGVVIGETARVGDDVTLYHGVTLGSRGWSHTGGPRARRHPVIGDDVHIGVGASVLGPVTIAAGTRIRAHSLVLEDLPTPTPVRAPLRALTRPSRGFRAHTPRKQDTP
ncbi:serine O-acetyltransferase [Streptomyces sp. NBC_01351]|uniref:serine O-acetyltransferase n=1 Tax=Streptomyces sp. NBC_01351 TaxID=2903833 RepID=UPI002E365BFD|nr:serine O-acetyltransferase [Streptomyces sp. NBC_01351]